MKWQNKEIVNLTDDELLSAIRAVGDIDNFRFDKLAQPRKRHEKLFAAAPPVENPAFTKLVNELNSEFKNRKLANV